MRGRVRRVPGLPRGAARAPRPPRPADRSSRPPRGRGRRWSRRLRCLRGIDTLTAVGLVAEIGDFTAFAHPKQLASFLGLVPSEQSSGDKPPPGLDHQRPAASHARRLLIEAAWHYRRRPARLADAQAPPGRPATRSDRRRLARTAAAASPLGAPRRRAAPRSAPPSRSPSPANSPASSGRSPTSPTDTATTSRSGWGWRPAPRHTGPAIPL